MIARGRSLARFTEPTLRHCAAAALSMLQSPNDTDGWTPLHYAVSVNNPGCINALALAGADLTAKALCVVPPRRGGDGNPTSARFTPAELYQSDLLGRGFVNEAGVVRHIQAMTTALRPRPPLSGRAAAPAAAADAGGEGGPAAISGGAVQHAPQQPAASGDSTGTGGTGSVASLMNTMQLERGGAAGLAGILQATAEEEFDSGPAAAARRRQGAKRRR